MKLGSVAWKDRGGRGEAAFTMVEIAIALAVIAFALIAIIGILPTGLQVQRDNREETLVNQDARLLLEAIKTGGRDITSDLGRYVVATNDEDCTQFTPPGIPTANLIQLLTDPFGRAPGVPYNDIVMSSVSGAIATRGSDMGFQYHIRCNVTNSVEFSDTVLSNQVYEVRLRFAWPVLPNGKLASDANTYKVRTLVSGTFKDGYFYAQHYWNNIYTNAP
jgi:type II secretory pathway pseudopilin PulG